MRPASSSFAAAPEARNAASGCVHVQGNRLAIFHTLLPQSHAAGCRALWRGVGRCRVAPLQLMACLRAPASRTRQRGPTTASPSGAALAYVCVTQLCGGHRQLQAWEKRTPQRRSVREGLQARAHGSRRTAVATHGTQRCTQAATWRGALLAASWQRQAQVRAARVSAFARAQRGRGPLLATRAGTLPAAVVTTAGRAAGELKEGAVTRTTAGHGTHLLAPRRS
jgi:hypothetical protein